MPSGHVVHFRLCMYTDIPTYTGWFWMILVGSDWLWLALVGSGWLYRSLAVVRLS